MRVCWHGCALEVSIWCLLQSLPSPFFSILKQGLLLCLELIFGDMTGHQAQGASCLCLLWPGMTSLHHYTHLLTWVLGRDHRSSCLQPALYPVSYGVSSALSLETLQHIEAIIENHNNENAAVWYPVPMGTVTKQILQLRLRDCCRRRNRKTIGARGRGSSLWDYVSQ